MGKKNQLCAINQEAKLKFEGFSQNGCYHGNQSQSFEVVFYSVDANSFC